MGESMKEGTITYETEPTGKEVGGNTMKVQLKNKMKTRKRQISKRAK